MNLEGCIGNCSSCGRCGGYQAGQSYGIQTNYGMAGGNYESNDKYGAGGNNYETISY